MTQDLDAALRRFGHASFRSGQREAIETLLHHDRLLLVAPTGGGKSLAYQLPASLLPGTTLVVSPLIALMHDQVEALERSGVASTYLASTLDPPEIARRIAALGRGDYRLVYVAPERLAQPGFGDQCWNAASTTTHSRRRKATDTGADAVGGMPR